MNELYIYGRKPIIAALRSGAAISKIYLTFGSQGDEIDLIYTLAKRSKISITQYDNQKFNNLLRNNNLDKENHQGVIALKEIGQALPLFQLLDEALMLEEFPLLILMDEIQDPHNLGSIARTAEAAGAKGLIITDSESSPITPTAFKVSAGALEFIPYSIVKNINQAFTIIREKGFWIVATDSNAELDYTQISSNKPIVLIIGNEGKGIRPHIKKMADQLVRIPLFGKTESLNASVAAGIVIFEIIKQKNKDK